MFDEINRKGFEGDLVLNGFAEFLRNLLVSRDPKVAMLLEVAEDFKQKYLQIAQKISPAFIVSALNILNEAITGMGKRYIKFILVSPLTCPKKLNKIYNNVEIMKNSNTKIKQYLLY